MRYVDIQARSVEEAVRLALEQLGKTRDQVKVEVLATDPNGDEVLVRVLTKDAASPGPTQQQRVGRPGIGADRSERFRPRGDRERGDRDRERGGRTGGMGRPPRGERGDRYGARQALPPLVDEEEPEAADELMETSGITLDSSLRPEAAVGEAATPQDAVAPLAAEILQKILAGMRLRGRIMRRDPEEEGEAAFADDADSVVLNVIGLNERDQSILIGRRGETLDALQFILNLILGRKVDLWARVIVDVEGYRLRRKLALMNLARRTAEQVEQRNQAIPLEAMPAYERRIIHLTLHDHPTVTTESSGAEPERRVVVLPRAASGD